MVRSTKNLIAMRADANLSLSSALENTPLTGQLTEVSKKKKKIRTTEYIRNVNLLTAVLIYACEDKKLIHYVLFKLFDPLSIIKF